jgi:hypothetical protein
MKRRCVRSGAVFFLLFIAPLLLMNSRVHREKKDYDRRVEFDFDVDKTGQEYEVLLKITYQQLERPAEGEYRAVLIYPSGRRETRLFSLPGDPSGADRGKMPAGEDSTGAGYADVSRTHLEKLFDAGGETGGYRVVVREKHSESMKGVCMTVSIWMDRADEFPTEESFATGAPLTPWI